MNYFIELLLILTFVIEGDLPENLFFESGANGNGKLDKTTKKNGLQDAADRSIKNKNETIEFCVLSESCANISSALQDLRKSKRKLRSEFINDCCGGNKKNAMGRIDSFVQKQKVTDNKENESDSDLYDAPDSQESILEELYELEKNIETQKAAMEVATKALKKKSSNL